MLAWSTLSSTRTGREVRAVIGLNLGASLLAALGAFYLEHRLCGDLDGGVDEDHVWLACDACSMTIVRRL